MARKSFVGTAPSTTLAGNINNSVLTITLASGTGYPDGASYPFVIVLDPGEATEEKVLCDSRSGATITVNASGRGFDGSTAAAHTAGAIIQHVLDAASIEEFSDHVYDTGNDHHTQYLNTTRHDVTARHAVGTVVPAGVAATTIQPDDAAAEGSNSTVSRSDHKHAIATATAVAVTTATNSEGVSTSFSRADHSHGLTDLAVTTAKINDLAVTTGKLAADAVDGTKIADDAVDTEHIADAAVEEAQIANGAVTSTKLGSLAIDADQLASRVLGGTNYAIKSGLHAASLAGAAAGTGTIDIDPGLSDAWSSPPHVLLSAEAGSNADLVVNATTDATTTEQAYRVATRNGGTVTLDYTIRWLAIGPLDIL